MTNYNAPNDTLAQYDEAFAMAQSRLYERTGDTIDFISDNSRVTLPNDNQFDVLRGGKEHPGGFREVFLPASEIPRTTALLGSIVLFLNTRSHEYNPAMITPVPGMPTTIRIARLQQAFVPENRFDDPGRTGLTPGIVFALAVEKQTMRPEFAGHDTTPGKADGAHVGVALTTPVSGARAQELVARGDGLSDDVIAGGLARDYAKLGMVPGGIIPVVHELDVSKLAPGTPLPIFWHKELDTPEGPAQAVYNNALHRLMGKVVDHIGPDGFDFAAKNIQTATTKRIV